jgi:hypothetical protein
MFHNDGALTQLHHFAAATVNPKQTRGVAPCSALF